MSITLSDGITTLELPYELVWIDKYQWSGKAQNLNYTTTGVMLLETSTLQGGRPITLADIDAWIEKSDLDTLHGWLQDNKQMVLKLHDDSSYRVQWRLTDQPCIEFEPVVKKAIQESTDEYIITLKFLETPTIAVTTTTTTTSSTTTSSSTTTTTTTTAP